MTLGKSKAGFKSRPDGDAISLHSQPDEAATSSSRRALLDEDDDAPELAVDDLPPLYSEVDPQQSTTAASSTDDIDSLAVAASRMAPRRQLAAAPEPDEEDVIAASISAQTAGQRPMPAYIGSGNNGKEVQSVIHFFRDHALHGDQCNLRPSDLLEFRIRKDASMPPRKFIRLRGTHSETAKKSDRDKENKRVTVIDFDVQVEVTPYLYSDPRTGKAWREVQTVHNWEKVRRGTVFKRTAPNFNSSAPPAAHDEETEPLAEHYSDEEAQDNNNTDIEARDPNEPSLTDWCQTFCADNSRLKVFSLKRQVVGFDEAQLRKKLELLVRRTNYRGHLEVSFPVTDRQVDIYNEHWINTWRRSGWAKALCIITLMIIFVWPFLYFTTKRYEVVTSTWSYSRLRKRLEGETDEQYLARDGGKEYATVSEEQLYNLWGRAINRAVLEKRQKVLDQEDLRMAEGAEQTFQSGNATVDNAVGFVQAGINAMNHVNQQFGWGADC